MCGVCYFVYWVKTFVDLRPECLCIWPSGVVVPGEVGILLIYAPNCFLKGPDNTGKGWTTCVKQWHVN